MSSTTLSIWESLLCKVMRYGHIPKHVAFIMDGNRRYANSLGKSKVEGHKYGVESLKKCLLICLTLGISQVTLFAFAIQNFSRQQAEIEALMELTKTNFAQMSKQKGFFKQKEIKIKIIGKKELIRVDVRECLDRIQEETKNHQKLQVNVCFSYNSTYQITEACRVAQQKCQKKDSIPMSTFMDSLMIGCPDMIVRTSNEIRLSDFLTVQAMKSRIYFLQENWPEVNIVSFLRLLIPYNANLSEFLKHKEVFQREIDSLS